MFALLLLAFHAASPVPPCPNLTGDYVIQGGDGRVRVSIKQTACTKIAISWTSTLTPPGARIMHALTLNNVFHADSLWYGQTEAQTTAASFRNNVLEILEKPLGATAADPVAWTLRLSKLANGDLCTKFTQVPVNIASLAARRTLLTKAAEDAAAKRSEAGCTMP